MNKHEKLLDDERCRIISDFDIQMGDYNFICESNGKAVPILGTRG